jgi:hypothetical protein
VAPHHNRPTLTGTQIVMSKTPFDMSKLATSCGFGATIASLTSLYLLLGEGDRASTSAAALIAIALSGDTLIIAAMAITLFHHPKFPALGAKDLKEDLRPVYDRWRPVSLLSMGAGLLAGSYMICMGNDLRWVGFLLVAFILMANAASWINGNPTGRRLGRMLRLPLSSDDETTRRRTSTRSANA